MPVQQAQAKHLPPLDGLRGVAILMVLLFHVWRVPGGGVSGPVSHAIENFASIGWTGVELFFVLSGFLITGILLDARQATNYFRVFYARRVLRIFPLYYLTLIAFFWVWPLLAHHVAFFQLHGQGTFGPREQLWYWFDLVNLRTAFYPLIIVMLTHCWTLSLEEQFYAVWPVVVRFLRERWLVAGSIAVVVLSPALRALPWVQSMNAVYPNFTYRFTPFNLDTLLTGALLAVLWEAPRPKAPALGSRRRVGGNAPRPAALGSLQPGGRGDSAYRPGSDVRVLAAAQPYLASPPGVLRAPAPPRDGKVQLQRLPAASAGHCLDERADDPPAAPATALSRQSLWKLSGLRRSPDRHVLPGGARYLGDHRVAPAAAEAALPVRGSRRADRSAAGRDSLMRA